MVEAPIIRKAIVSLVNKSEAEIFFELRDSLIKNDSKLEADIPIPIAFIEAVSNSLSLLKNLSTTVCQINLPDGDWLNAVYFVCLSGDRLYTIVEHTLYVFSMSDYTSPISTYEIRGPCLSGIIIDNHLYLCGNKKLHVFEVTNSLTQPVIPVKVIDTMEYVGIILRVGNELLLGEYEGYL